MTGATTGALPIPAPAPAPDDVEDQAAEVETCAPAGACIGYDGCDGVRRHWCRQCGMGTCDCGPCVCAACPCPTHPWAGA